MRRRGLRDNNITTKRIMKDMIEEGRHDDAKRVRAEMTPYRQTGSVKRFENTGKITKYKNLAAFNRECPKQIRGSFNDAMVCSLETIRPLANGEGMASVYVRPLFDTTTTHGQRNGKRRGTWRLHFASFDLLKRHLRGRVEKNHNPNPLELEGRRKGRR